MNNETLVREINKNMSIALSDEISLDELQKQLGVYVNELIQSNFQKLIMLLYRIEFRQQKDDFDEEEKW